MTGATECDSHGYGLRYGCSGIANAPARDLALIASGVTMVVLTVLDRDRGVLMLLFREDLAVLHWLHRSVIMVLVDLAVNGSGGLLMAGLGNGLVGNCGGDLLVDSGVMVTSLGPGERKSLSASAE